VSRISNPHTAAFLRQSYDAIISYMNTKSDRSAAERADIHRSFLKQTTGLDKLRSEDFLETFPELAAHYNKKIA
jgi:hypothetical protein